MSHFVSVPSLVLFPKNNKPWNKRKEDFLYIWLLQRITLNNHIFRNTCMYINNPYWQSSGIIIILCKYDTVTSDTLTDSWMYFFGCSLWYYQSFMGIPEEMIELQRKVNREFVRVTLLFLAARPPFYIIFVAFFV